MPKIKIYIDAQGNEHRVGPNSEKRFLEENDGAKFIKDEYIFGEDKDVNELTNSENFELKGKNGVLLKKKEGEEEPTPEVSYQYVTAGKDDDFKSGWQKTTFEGPTGKERVEPVKQEEVPDEFYNNHIQTQKQRHEDGEDLHQSEVMEIYRPTRDEVKENNKLIKEGMDTYLAVTKKRIPTPPTTQTTIPQNAMIGDGDGGDSYVQGNITSSTKEAKDYEKISNAHNLEQRNNNNSKHAEYYKKAQKQLKNLGKGTSEEEIMAQAMELAAKDYRADYIAKKLRKQAEKQSDTFTDGILISDDKKKTDQDILDYQKQIAIGVDEAGDEVYGPKLTKSINETRLAETTLENNAVKIKEQKDKIDEAKKFWKDQYDKVESEMEDYTEVPSTISTLNNLNKQLEAFNEKAEDGGLPEKEYNKYKALVDKYNDIYSTNKGDIDSYIKLQKKYQDIDFDYRSQETKNGKSTIDDLIVNYNTSLGDQNDTYKAYQMLINDQNGMIEDSGDMAAYIDIVGRNHNNVAQFGGILTNSLIEIGMTVETVKHQLNPRVLIADGLKEYYKGDPEEAPEMVKGFLAASDYANIPRDKVRRAVSGVQDYLTGSLQKRIEWKDLGDGVDDAYEWGEYVLGSASDFVPQLALMTVAPQASLYILATSAAGGKYEQLKEENKHGADYSMAEMYFASGLSGVAEFATERVTLGLLNKTGSALKNMQNAGFKDGIARLVNPLFIGRGVVDLASEASSEVAAKIFGDNLGDIILGKNVSILDGIDEAAFNGLVMGKIVKSPIIAKALISPFMRPSDQAIFDKNDAKIIEIEKALSNPDISDNTRSLLESQLDAVLAENNNVYSRIIDNTDEMTKDEYKIIQDADKSLNDSKETIANIKADDTLSLADQTKLIKEVMDVYYKKNKLKNETLKEINLRNDMKVAEKGLKKLDPNAKLEGIDTRREFQKRYEEITGKKDDVTNKDAFFDPISGDAYVNKTRAKQVGAVSAGSHELLHKIMKNVLNGTDGKLTTKGKTLIDGFLNSIPAKHRAIIQKRIDDNYRYERGPNREIIKEKDPMEYYEEYLNSYSDAIRKKEINPKDGDLLGVGRKIKDFFSDSGYENLKFNSGRDVKNFIKDYAADIKSGEVRESILAVGQGDGAKIGEAKFSESAFEDAGVVEDLGLKNNTADIVRKNNKIEEAILREGVKDKDGNVIASPNMQRALAENNLPRAFALARQAANKGNDLTLEEGLKMNDVMEFFSEYSLKLTELARTYKAEMKDPKTGKTIKVPFGAYMNSLLPLKYSGILNKLKNKIQASSMSEEGTAKAVGRIATPSGELANNEVEGKKVALNTIDQAETQELLVNMVKEDPSLAKLRKYKEVKEELTKHDKFTKEGNPITDEIKAKRKKEKKKPLKELKTKRKPTGKLFENLKAVSEGIFGVDATRILQEQDLNTEQRKSAQDAILKHTNEIIAMMPFGTTASGDATGVANTKLGIFYEKLARTKMKATGTGKGLATQQKQNIDPVKFRELVGLVKGGRINNTSVDGAIRAIIVQVASIANNQAVRQVYGPETMPLKDGKASVMFSETYSTPFLQEMYELSRAMQKEQGSWKSIAKSFKFTPIDMKSETGRSEFERWMFNNLNQYLPLSFFQHTGNWTGTFKTIEKDGILKKDWDATRDSKAKDIHGKNWADLSDAQKLKVTRAMKEVDVKGIDGKVRKMQGKATKTEHAGNYVYKNVDELNKAIQEHIDDGGMWQGEAMPEQDQADVAAALKRYPLNDKTLNDAKLKASKKRGFEIIWKKFDQMMIDNPANAPFIMALLSSSSATQGHFMRTGAVNGFTNLEDGKTVEEHQQPATDLAKFLFNRLMQKNLFKDDTFKNAIAGYQQGKLLRVDDAKLKNTKEGWSYQSNAGEYMYAIFAGKMPVEVRYINPRVNGNNGGINPNSYRLANGNTWAENWGVNVDAKLTTPAVIAKQQDLLFKVFTGLITQKAATKAVNEFANAKFSSTIESDMNSDKAAKFSSTVNTPKGITVLDFDDTLATSNSLIRFTKPDGTKGTLNAEQYAKTYQELTDLGYKWDFSEFNEVVDGKIAPLFNKAMKLQGKFGPKNMFVLTARPMQSAPAIFEFLQANGLNIPIENITGLGNSTGEAKANWMAEKVADGYNDFYFADDALQNVVAVQKMLDQYDVKSKVQQAKVKFSESLNPKFNDILEQTTGIKSEKVFSDAQAKIRGAKTKYKSIIPASAQDFKGLLYNFIGKGKKGEVDMAFFQKALIDPFARGINQLNTSRQNSANDYKNLQKAFPEVKKTMNEKVGNTQFNNDQATRVYLWNKAGFEVPGLSQRDLKTLVDHVEATPSLQAFAEGISLISKKENGYSKPGDFWLAENITSDLLSDGSIGDARADVLTEWQQNVDVMFSPENLNKIEAIYGNNFREALEDILYRMRTGKNRPAGGGRLVNQYMNWVNNSVGAIMFFNMRSAILQTISATNYINWSFNNPAKAAMAFANQKQYWKDFSMLFNSPYLKQRRSGNQRGINEAELSAAVAGAENKAKAAIAWLLKKGFLPTQLADSFAIASGGATFYRNKIKQLVKQGMSQEQAEKQAFLTFQETTEVSQQSARPDMISQQQASPLGRLILSFQNTPMQYARIMNKAARDLANGRGDSKTHLSKIAYYGVAQSILFGALQSALMASMGDDEEDEFDKKKERILNGMIDSVLSGIGYGGKAVSTVKNSIREYIKQKDKGWNADHTYTILSLLSFSPPIGSKLRKIYGSIQTEQFNEGVFKKRGFTLDNPVWSGIGNVVEGITNVPLGRISQKMLNIDNAMDDSNSFFERAALLLGWNTWDLGIKDKDIEAVKTEIKEEKKVKKKEEQKVKKEIKKKEQEEANKAVIEENKKKSKKDGICSAVSKGGKRCKSKAVNGGFCTVHEKAVQNKTGKKSQCKHIKKGGKQCGMQTSSKSGFCYYHD